MSGSMKGFRSEDEIALQLAVDESAAEAAVKAADKAAVKKSVNKMQMPAIPENIAVREKPQRSAFENRKWELGIRTNGHGLLLCSPQKRRNQPRECRLRCR